VPTKAEAEAIMKVLVGTDIECQALLALTCSLRQSEIAALKKSSIKGSDVTIRGARVLDEDNKLVYKETNKSAAGRRTVTMPKYLSDKIKEICKGKEPDEYLFNAYPDDVLAKFKRLLKNNGLPQYTMHSLRHCFAAIMHANNVPDKYIMEMGGWSSDSVMKKIYQYTFEDETKKAKKKVNSYFDGVMQHEMHHESKKSR
jgi:integrase